MFFPGSGEITSVFVKNDHGCCSENRLQGAKLEAGRLLQKSNQAEVVA